MVQIYINQILLGEYFTGSETIEDYVKRKTQLHSRDFYITQNGRILNECDSFQSHYSVQCILRTHGGKGGFGSMLRAIGAQIEKTTNREACRDLSGRRLRDINEEKRLKAWLEKQCDREREAEERKKKKIEKLLHVPKHEFKDKDYEETRSKLSEKVTDAVEEGLKKAITAESKQSDEHNLRKRKGDQRPIKNKKKKNSLWIDEDLSSSDCSSECSDEEKLLPSGSKKQIK